MKDVLAYIDRKIAAIDGHPLFGTLSSDATPLKDKLLLLPSVVTMAMGFRDVNKWALRYPEATTDLERGINIHTFEDQTHSRLFLEDWRRLGLDAHLGWRASDTLWWLFLADANEQARRHGVHFLSLGAGDGGDPVLRFAQAEVGERCARDVFFKHASAIATRLTEETGVEYLYLGPHHIAAEGEGAEDLFETQVLDDERRVRALELVDAMFEIFVDAFDAMLNYWEAYVATGTSPRRCAYEPVAETGGGPRVASVHPTQEPLERLLRERTARAARHPLFTWFQHRGPGVTASRALQRLLPLWAIDVLGRGDLHRYAMSYPEPATEAERAVNDAAARLAGQNAAFLNDWRQLGLDDLLGWTASQTLEFCYLDRLLDGRRRDRARLIALAATERDPLVRLWLMRAVESTTEVFLEGAAALAFEAEAATGARLDFLTGPHRRHGLPPEPFAAKMAADRVEVATGLLATVFDSADDHLDLTLDVALSNDLRIL